MHPTLDRLITAIDALDQNAQDKAREQLKAIKDRMEDPSMDAVRVQDVAELESAFGVSRSFVLFGAGNPVIDQAGASQAGNTKDSGLSKLEAFKVRIDLILSYARMPMSDIIEALEVSRQSPSHWKRTGQMAKDKLEKLCNLEGLDYDWVVDGRCSSEQGKQGIKALYQRMRDSINSSVEELETKRDQYEAVAGNI